MGHDQSRFFSAMCSMGQIGAVEVQVQDISIQEISAEEILSTIKGQAEGDPYPCLKLSIPDLILPPILPSVR